MSGLLTLKTQVMIFLATVATSIFGALAFDCAFPVHLDFRGVVTFSDSKWLTLGIFPAVSALHLGLAWALAHSQPAMAAQRGYRAARIGILITLMLFLALNTSLLLNRQC